MNIKSNHFKKIILAVFFSGITVLLSEQSVHDSEIKRNVTDISTPLQKLVQLEPKVFEYNTEKYKHLKFKSGKTFGFMSDNMPKRLFPD